MRRLRMVYICDKCGASALREKHYCMFGDVIKTAPEGWGTFAKMDLCPKCYKVINRVFDDEECVVTVGNPLCGNGGEE